MQKDGAGGKNKMFHVFKPWYVPGATFGAASPLQPLVYTAKRGVLYIPLPKM